MYVLAAVEVEATEATLFLLDGDSEPRGSSRRLISMMLGWRGLRQVHALRGCLDRYALSISGVSSSRYVEAREITEAMQDGHLMTTDALFETSTCCRFDRDRFCDEEQGW